MIRIMITCFLVLTVLGSSAQELERVLDNHFEVHGQDMWDQVNSVIVEGKWLTEEFHKYPMKLTYKSPNKVRWEGKWRGKRFVEATNGVAFWKIAPWQDQGKPDQMSSEDRLKLNNMYALGSPLKAFESKLQLAGLEMYEGELLIHVYYEGQFRRHDYYLGKEDFVLYWEVIESKTGRSMTIRKQYEKYRNYHGLLAPTAVRIFGEDNEWELVFEDVMLGAGAQDGIFEMPESP